MSTSRDSQALPYGVPVQAVNKVAVKSTLVKPFIPMSQRPDITSERLLMRPFQPSDLDGYYRLRSQNSVMQWTGQGCADVDLDDTKSKLALLLPPEGDKGDIYAITLQETGDFLGSIGIKTLDGGLGWPEVGYMLLEEHWGKGYATEVMRAYLEHWWKLPRVEGLVDLNIDFRTLKSGEGVGSVVREQLSGITGGENTRSKHVLEKLGFKLAAAYAEEEEEAHLGLVGTAFVLEVPSSI